jgi:hypothetical protein
MRKPTSIRKFFYQILTAKLDLIFTCGEASLDTRVVTRVGLIVAGDVGQGGENGAARSLLTEQQTARPRANRLLQGLVPAVQAAQVEPRGLEVDLLARAQRTVERVQRGRRAHERHAAGAAVVDMVLGRDRNVEAVRVVGAARAQLAVAVGVARLLGHGNVVVDELTEEVEELGPLGDGLLRGEELDGEGARAGQAGAGHHRSSARRRDVVVVARRQQSLVGRQGLAPPEAIFVQVVARARLRAVGPVAASAVDSNVRAVRVRHGHLVGAVAQRGRPVLAEQLSVGAQRHLGVLLDLVRVYGLLSPNVHLYNSQVSNQLETHKLTEYHVFRQITINVKLNPRDCVIR